MLVPVDRERAGRRVVDHAVRHRRVFGGEIVGGVGAGAEAHLVRAAAPGDFAIFVEVGLAGVADRERQVVVRDASDVIQAFYVALRPRIVVDPGPGVRPVEGNGDVGPVAVSHVGIGLSDGVGGSIDRYRSGLRPLGTDEDAESGRGAAIVGVARSRMLTLAEEHVAIEFRERTGNVGDGGVVEPAGDRKVAAQIEIPVVGDEYAALLVVAARMERVGENHHRLPELARLAGPGVGRYLAVEAGVTGGVGDPAERVRGVHVPDADVVRPDFGRAGRHVRVRAAVGDGQTLAAREDRHLHPEKRLAGGIPRVDLVGKGRAILVRDFEVRAVAGRCIVEALDERRRKAKGDRHVLDGHAVVVERDRKLMGIPKRGSGKH